MASPSITNRRPDEGDTDVSVDTPFRFGIRDLDTRADLSTVYCSVTYARAFYIPEEDVLPAEANIEGSSLVLSMFDDASGTTNPGEPCQESTVDLGGGDWVYRLEKDGADDDPQEGVLYVTISAQDPVGPYSFKVTLEVDGAGVTAAPYAYTTHADYVGVVLGFVYWPENTGIFLLFRDDGTKRISIVGPSTDGIGTRSTEVSTVFNWAREITYTIVVDPTAYRRLIQVFATTLDGEETLLGEVDLDTINEFLPSVRMGRLYAEDTPTGYVTALVGLDGTDTGNYLDVHGFQVANFGKVLLVDGNPTPSGSTEVEPVEALFVLGSEGAEAWRNSGSFDEETTDTALHITATTGPSCKVRTEPDITNGEWMLLGTLTARNAVHAGSHSTGMGLRVEDGTKQYSLVLLDDFAEYTVGLVDSTAEEDAILVGYGLPAEAVDWEEDVPFIFMGSALNDFVRAFFGDEDTTPAIDKGYGAAGYTATTVSAVSFGVVESGSFAGDFYLTHLWVFPNCTFYEGSNGTYPDAQPGWTRTQALSTRSLAATSFTTDCTAVGAYDIYSVTDTTYGATSGAAVLFKARIGDWVDSAGATNPLRSQFGPIAAVRTSTVAVQLWFVTDSEGTTYAFLPSTSTDYLDVLAQNVVGRAISAEIDLSAEHVFLLDVKPLQHVRLYIDELDAPVLDVAWPAEITLRGLPTYMPASAVVAVGSLNEDAGVECTLYYARASIGRGYDFSITIDVSEEDLQDRVYGSLVDLNIDVQDED